MTASSPKLCGVLGEPALAQEAQYKTNADRVMNRGKLIAHLSELTMRLTRAELLARLEKVNVPAGPIYNLRGCVQRPAGEAPRHEAQSAGASREGWCDRRHPHADRDRRRTDGVAAPLAAAR